MNRTDTAADRSALLSRLWIFLVGNWLWCDVLTLMDPSFLRTMTSGGPSSLHLGQGFLLVAGLVMEIPLAMILLSRLLPMRLRRCANLLASIAMTAVQIGSFGMGDPPTLHYWLFSIVEVATLVAIFAIAFTWTPVPGDEAFPSADAPRRITTPSAISTLVLLASLAAPPALAEDPVVPIAATSHRDTACTLDGRVFLSTPMSLRETHSVLGIGVGYDAPSWMARIEVGAVDDPLQANEIGAVDLSTGIFWKHGLPGTISVYEGLVLIDQIGVGDQFEGHAVSLSLVAGCVLRPKGAATSFFVEAGTGGAFTIREGAYAGGTILGGGLRYEFGNPDER